MNAPIANTPQPNRGPVGAPPERGANGPRKENRFRPLDGLRAFAVAGVLVDHYLPHDLWFQSWLQWGQLGVQLFFVISGFLITGILLGMRPDGNSPALKPALYTFYARRFLRIFPPYYALLLVYALIRVPFPHGAGWACLLYYFNFLGLWTSYPFEYLSHFWTLCIEEQFYLVWPLLILALPRRWLAPLALVLVIQAPFFRSLLLESGVPYNALRSLPPSQLDFLAGGALVALMRWKQGGLVRSHAFFEKWRLLIGLTGFGVHFILLHWPPNQIWAMFNACGSVLMLTALVDWAAHGTEGLARKGLACEPLVYLGKISYGIYLYQFLSLLVLYKLQHLLNHPRLLESLPGFVAAWTAATLLLAAGSYHFLERPILRFKRCFPYHPAPATGLKHRP